MQNLNLNYVCNGVSDLVSTYHTRALTQLTEFGTNKRPEKQQQLKVKLCHCVTQQQFNNNSLIKKLNKKYFANF
jgi:hypothetical protein